MNPTLELYFWLRLLGILATEIGLVIALAFAAQTFIRPAFWRRAVWQIAFVCLLLLAGAELTGVGRGVSIWLAGKPVPERKVSVRVVPPDEQFIPAPVKTKMPAPAFVPQPETPVARSLWWPGILWLAGLSLVAARILCARIFLTLLRWQKPRITDEILLNRVAQLAQQLGLRRKIHLLETSGLSSPMTFGMVWPGIGLPSGFAQKFTPAQQNAMLAHELAHLAARDPFWYLLADVAAALLWWHPLVWWARRRLHSASEHAADEAAALLENGPGTLAECLVQLGRQMTRARSFGWLGVDGSGFRSHLGQRVERLLNLKEARQPLRGWKIFFAKTGFSILFAALVIFTSGWIQNKEEPREKDLPATVQKSWKSSFVSTAMAAWASERMELMAKNEGQTVQKAPVEIPKASELTVRHSLMAVEDAWVLPSKGRQLIKSKLDRIRLPEVLFEGLPLGKVLELLRDESKRRDPDQVGINFLFNSHVNAPAAAAPVDLNSVTVNINPALNNVRLADVLDAIVQVADKPLQYEIQADAVIFSLKSPEPVALYTRTFKVNPKTFQQALESVSSGGSEANEAVPIVDDIQGATGQSGNGLPRVTRTNFVQKVNLTVREYFTAAGVDFGPVGLPSGKMVFYKDRTGLLMVRATLKDMEIIQTAIESLTDPPQIETDAAASKELGFDWYERNFLITNKISKLPPQVTIEAKFVEIGEETMKKLGLDWFTQKAIFSTTNTAGSDILLKGTNVTNAKMVAAENVTNSLLGMAEIFSDPQCRIVLRALGKIEGVDILAIPKVTSLSGLQTQLSILDAHTIVNGPGLDSVTNANIVSTNGFRAENILTGPVLDVVPSVSADGYSIQMNVKAKLTEFLGYDDGRHQTLEGKKITSSPQPQVRIRTMTSGVSVWDGQTIVLGGMMDQVDKTKEANGRKNLLVFVTATIIDPAGNRVHTDEDSPFITNSVPKQTERK